MSYAKGKNFNVVFLPLQYSAGDTYRSSGLVLTVMLLYEFKMDLREYQHQQKSVQSICIFTRISLLCLINWKLEMNNNLNLGKPS